jgi:UDPglucose--hexose-1-phosphate uridylyltransferase
VSELRWNPLLGEWVITATHRQDRTFLPPPTYCPLCVGEAGQPPTEIARPDFGLAVFENRFPSLRAAPPPPSVRPTPTATVERAIGRCEVVVYTPDHAATLSQLGPAVIRRLVQVWAYRTRELAGDPRVQYVFCFENRGEAIGVTLHHPHGQIYAYPYVPPLIDREAESARAHADRTGRCLWCDLIDQELADGRRLIANEDSWLAGVPFFARWPYEVHLTPRRHVGWLHELDGGDVDGLARALHQVLVKYDGLFKAPLPYVLAVHQRPVRTDRGDFHLHIELYPPNRTETKLKHLAGSELGAGSFINDTLPEQTAARLRQVEPRPPKGAVD